MVENIATLRMANPWLENMMNHQCVESIHIRFKEPFGTQGRGGYFDQFNIIRDVLQVRDGISHLQLVIPPMHSPAKLSPIWISESPLASFAAHSHGATEHPF